MNITIFGAGAYGTALGKILTDNGHIITYYDPIKYPNQSLSTVTRSADVNIIATPSDALGKLLLFIPYDKPLICASKGFFSTEKFKNFKQFSAISGGAFASDLVSKKPSTLTATSKLAVQLFQTNWLTIEYTNDLLGVFLCGSLKNIYAIGSGFRGLHPDTEAFTNYIQAAYAELRLILAANGANPITVNLSCGSRDLVLTCASSASRNYHFGEQIRQDPSLPAHLSDGSAKLEITTEGYAALKALPSSGLHVPPEATLIREIQDLVFPPDPKSKKRKSSNGQKA